MHSLSVSYLVGSAQFGWRGDFFLFFPLIYCKTLQQLCLCMSTRINVEHVLYPRASQSQQEGALFYSSVPVNCDSRPECTIPVT